MCVCMFVLCSYIVGIIYHTQQDNLKTNKMREQAQELIDLGNSKEIAHGRGMLKVIDEVMRIIDIDGEMMSDGEIIDEIYELINNK